MPIKNIEQIMKKMKNRLSINYLMYNIFKVTDVHSN